MNDVRWKQRFNNFVNACRLLGEALSIESPTDLEKEGLIQRFEYTFELGWKTLKDYLEHQGFAEIVGFKDSIRLSFSNGIIRNGEIWMRMIADRNQTSHLYDSDIVTMIVEHISKDYYPAFIDLTETLQTREQWLR